MRSKLGTFPNMTLAKARSLAKEYKALSVLGKDPKLIQKKKDENQKNFGQVVADFIERRLTDRSKNTRTRIRFMQGWFLAQTRDAQFTKFWIANKNKLDIKSKKISEIDEDYLLEYFNCAVQRGKYGCNRLMGTIRMLINWEIRRKKYSGPNPVKIIKGEEFLWSEEEKDHLDFYSVEDMKKIITAIWGCLLTSIATSS